MLAHALLSLEKRLRPVGGHYCDYFPCLLCPDLMSITLAPRSALWIPASVPKFDAEHFRRKLDVNDAQSDETELVIIIVPTCISLILITTVFIVVLVLKKFKFSPLPSASRKLPPPCSSSAGSNVKLWLSKQQVQTTEASSPSRHSWPQVSVSGSNSHDPDKLSVVSQSALCRADFQQRFEDRFLSGECRLYPKPSSVRSSNLDSFPAAAVL